MWFISMLLASIGIILGGFVLMLLIAEFAFKVYEWITQ